MNTQGSKNNSEKESKNPKTKKEQKVSNKKNKILNKFNEKENSYKSSKKETNINADNPPSEQQIKKYENIGKEGMNTRVDIFKTKEKVSKLEKDLEKKNKNLEIASKQSENFKNYVNKLEKIVKEKTEPDNDESNNIPQSKDKSKESNIDKSIINKELESQNMTEQTEEKKN